MALSTAHINEILYNSPIAREKFIGTFASCQFGRVPEKRVYGFITNDQNHLLVNYQADTGMGGVSKMIWQPFLHVC